MLALSKTPTHHWQIWQGKLSFPGVPTTGQASYQRIFKATLYSTLQWVESHPYSAIPTQQFGEAGWRRHPSPAPPASSSPPCIALLTKFLLKWDGWALGKHLVVGGGPRRPLMLIVAFERGNPKRGEQGPPIHTSVWGRSTPKTGFQHMKSTGAQEVCPQAER